MTKAKAEKKITRLVKILRKVWFKYVDSLEEIGNEKIKETGYLTVAIFRQTSWFNSYVKVEDMKKENQVNVVMFTKGDKDEVESY